MLGVCFCKKWLRLNPYWTVWSPWFFALAKACNREFSFFPTMLQLHYLHLYISPFCDPSTSSLHGMLWRNNCKSVCLLTTSHPSVLDTNWMLWHPNTSPATFSRTQMIDSRTNRLAWNGKTKLTAVGTGSPTWFKEPMAVQIPLPNWSWEWHFPQGCLILTQ